MSLDLTNDKSTLVQVMAWCLMSPSHYLNQHWPKINVAIGCHWGRNELNIRTANYNVKYHMALKLTTFLLHCIWRNLEVLCHITQIQTMNCCLIIDPTINHNYFTKACWQHWHQRTTPMNSKNGNKKSISSPQPQRWFPLIKNLFSNLASDGLMRQPPANEKQKWSNYCKISDIRRTKSPKLIIPRLVLQLSLLNPMKPCVRSRMKM